MINFSLTLAALNRALQGVNRHLLETFTQVRKSIEFLGRHRLVAGLLVVLSVAGTILSVVGFHLDRSESQSTTEQVAGVDRHLDTILKVIKEAERDWQVMEKAFFGIHVGGPIQPAYDLDFPRLLREGDGVYKSIKWQLPNSNTFLVTYDSEKDRILRIEIEWGGQDEGRDVGISNFRFGETRLQSIRDTFMSNGFAYAVHMMSQTKKGVVTYNAFELKDTPTIILVTKTIIPYEVKDEIDKLPPEKQVMGAIGSYWTLIGVSVADESYLDHEWGEVKIYDPESKPISLE